MVRRERLINKLRELGFRFKRDAWRVQLWQKGMLRPEIPKRDLLDEETVCNILRQCHLKNDEIAAFLRQAIN
jgi:hypothetical protein